MLRWLQNRGNRSGFDKALIGRQPSALRGLVSHLIDVCAFLELILDELLLRVLGDPRPFSDTHEVERALPIRVHSASDHNLAAYSSGVRWPKELSA